MAESDYLPEVAALDLEVFPSRDRIALWLAGTTTVQPLPIARNTPDWMLGSFWAHPERVLDPAARDATSGFARMAPTVVDRVVTAVRRDLQNGEWDRRHGHLRNLPAHDVGLRLLINHPTDPPGPCGRPCRLAWPWVSEMMAAGVWFASAAAKRCAALLRMMM